ncbi:MAG: ABC transporter permease [Bacteroidota bacterium]
MQPTPPNTVLKFLRWFCREDYIDEIEGDLTEIFKAQYSRSPVVAKWNFLWTVLRHFRPAFMKTTQGKTSNATTMIRHNLLLIIRHYRKAKTSFLVNFLSLFIGITSTLLIYLWVQDELKIDGFHTNRDRLVQILQNDRNPSNVSTEPYTPGLLAETLVREFPAVDRAVSVVPYDWFEGEQLLLSSGSGRIFTSQNQFASADYFQIFSFEFLNGSKSTALDAPNAVVITDEMAMKLFETKDVLGRSLDWLHEDYGGTYQITGVVKSLPSYSTVQFDAVFPYAAFLKANDNLDNWNNSDPYTYLTLHETYTLDDLNLSLAGFMESKSGYENQSLFGQLFSERYLHGKYENGVSVGGRISYVKLFSLIAVFILTIAIINFVNMATAEANDRVKEIGVKKAIGIHRNGLIQQFLTESLLVSFLALFAALLFILLILPQYNSIVGKQIVLAWDLNLIAAALALTLGTGLLAGLYPALHLSGFSPVKALKGVVAKGQKAQQLRRGLVVFQFSISTILIFAVIVVYQQIEYIQSKNLGFDKENIIWFTSGVPSAEDKEFTGQDIESLLVRLNEIPGVVNATNFAQNIAGQYGATTGVSWPGKDPEQDILFANFSAGYDFIQTLSIPVIEGRQFSRDFKADTAAIIFNKAAVEAMGLTDPVGQTIELWGEPREIVGLVDNFHIGSLHEDILPTFIKVDVNSFASNFMVKLAAGNQSQTIDQINAEFRTSFIDGMPFDFTFLDDNYQKLYENEIKTSVLSRYAAILAIIISCLGLFGFANFMVRKRIKEVGIRKVLGASRLNVIRLVSIEFNIIVLVSILIALPVVYVLINEWLSGFAFRIEITIWQALLGSTLVMLSAWLTITAQTLKAANVNPVECLKGE